MYVYGREEDIKRFFDCLDRGGQYLCKLNKMPQGELTSFDNAEMCDVNAECFSTVTARYYKGIGSHKDNMVLEIRKL